MQARGAASKAVILDTCEMMLMAEGPRHTRDLERLLASRGIQVGGKSPAATLSVFLSRDARFKSDRVSGWSVVQPHEEETPQGVAAPAGSDLWVSQSAPTEGTASTAD